VSASALPKDAKSRALVQESLIQEGEREQGLNDPDDEELHDERSETGKTEDPCETRAVELPTLSAMTAGALLSAVTAGESQVEPALTLSILLMFRWALLASIAGFFAGRRGRVVLIIMIGLTAVIPLFIISAGTAIEAISVSTLVACFCAVLVAIPLGLPRFLVYCGFYVRLHQTLTSLGTVSVSPNSDDVRPLRSRITPAVEGEVNAYVRVTLRYVLHFGRNYDERFGAPSDLYSIERTRTVSVSCPLLAELTTRTNRTLSDELQMASFQRLVSQQQTINSARFMPSVGQDTIEVAMHYFRHSVWVGNPFLSGNGSDLRV
jgi:hypothetical protein